MDEWELLEGFTEYGILVDNLDAFPTITMTLCMDTIVVSIIAILQSVGLSQLSGPHTYTSDFRGGPDDNELNRTNFHFLLFFMVTCSTPGAPFTKRLPKCVEESNCSLVWGAWNRSLQRIHHATGHFTRLYCRETQWFHSLLFPTNGGICSCSISRWLCLIDSHSFPPSSLASTATSCTTAHWHAVAIWTDGSSGWWDSTRHRVNAELPP